MTPTARTLTLLRQTGHLAAVVESWIPRINSRRDLFRFADELAVHPARRVIALIQVSTIGHVAHRLKKVKGVPELPGLLAAGIVVQVHGWYQRDGHWQVKIVEVLAGDLEAVVIVPKPRRGPSKLRQGNLFADLAPDQPRGI